MKHWIRLLLVVMTCWTSLSSCEDKDPKVASGKAMVKAMKLLDKGEMDKFCQCLDFGQELDSITEAQIARMWVMHQQINLKTKGQIVATDVVKVDLQADTVAIVYYKIKYASGNEEVSSNKMIQKNGIWKIRVRN